MRDASTIFNPAFPPAQPIAIESVVLTDVASSRLLSCLVIRLYWSKVCTELDTSRKGKAYSIQFVLQVLWLQSTCKSATLLSPHAPTHARTHPMLLHARTHAHTHARTHARTFSFHVPRRGYDKGFLLIPLRFSRWLPTEQFTHCRVLTPFQWKIAGPRLQTSLCTTASKQKSASSRAPPPPPPPPPRLPPPLLPL